jgi:hypothetical protein
MKFILAFIFIIFITGCDLTAPKDVDKINIKNILRDIETAFRNHDIDAIMQFYHPQFYHDEEHYQNVKERWLIRLIDYIEIQITNISVTFTNDEWAVASFSLRFIAVNQTYTFDEPSLENGDFSYFVKESGVWRICGKDYSPID